MAKGAGPAIARKGGHPAILRKGWGFPSSLPEFEFCICDTCPPLDEFEGVESWYGVDWTALTFSDASPRTFTTGDAVWPVLLAHAFDPPSSATGITGGGMCLSLTAVGEGYFGVDFTPVEGPIAVTSGGITIGYKWRYGPGVPYYNTVTEAMDTTDEDCWVFVRVTSLKRVIVKETLPVLKELVRLAASRSAFKYTGTETLRETVDEVEKPCLYITCPPFYFRYDIVYETEVEFDEAEEGAGETLQETNYGGYMWESFVAMLGLISGGSVIFQIASLTSADWVGPGEVLTSSWFCDFAAGCITNASIYWQQTVATGVACIDDETTVTMTSVACNTTPMGGLNLLDWPAISLTCTWYFCDPLP